MRHVSQAISRSCLLLADNAVSVSVLIVSSAHEKNQTRFGKKEPVAYQEKDARLNQEAETENEAVIIPPVLYFSICGTM